MESKKVMLLESRALAGRKRNGLILSTFGGGGGGGAQSEEDEEDSRGLLGSKMQAEGTTAATTAVTSGLSGCTRDEGDDSSSQSPNGSLINNINNNCNSNRQCATDFSIAAIMARDSRHQQQQQQQQQPIHQNHHSRHSQQLAVGGGKLHQHGEFYYHNVISSIHFFFRCFSKRTLFISSSHQILSLIRRTFRLRIHYFLWSISPIVDIRKHCKINNGLNFL